MCFNCIIYGQETWELTERMVYRWKNYGKMYAKLNYKRQKDNNLERNQTTVFTSSRELNEKNGIGLRKLEKKDRC